jgi:PadR family transcriptional regulator, regulatory protein PadR
MNESADVLQATAALMVLRTIDALGPIHGYGIARRNEQVSKGLLALKQWTLHPKWGVSDIGRKAKFCLIIRSGEKQLAEEMKSWQRLARVAGKFADPGRAV